jgi:hypothetical protein
MIIENPVYGKIKIPDTKKEIVKEVRESRDMVCDDKYSLTWLQAYIDALDEGLDIFRRMEESQC